MIRLFVLNGQDRPSGDGCVREHVSIVMKSNVNVPEVTFGELLELMLV